MRLDKNNVPIIAEEQIIEEEQNFQEILTQFNQLVPVGFTKLESKGYMCSTEGWKEPVYERYMFLNQGKSVQLDIPQKLITELGLKKGQNIPYPFYVLPAALNKELSFGAIEIKDKKEIFIQKPLTINNLEQELNEWLTELETSREKISQLTITEKLSQDLTEENQLLKIELQGEKQLAQAQKENQKNKIKLLQDQLQEKERKIRELENEKDQLENRVGEKDKEINQLTTEKNALENKNEFLQREKSKLKTDLDREKGWWDKWINDKKETHQVISFVSYPYQTLYVGSIYSSNELQIGRQLFSSRLSESEMRQTFEKEVFSNEFRKKAKMNIKGLYEYYKNQEDNNHDRKSKSTKRD